MSTLNVVIAGGASGIGLATATQFAAAIAYLASGIRRGHRHRAGRRRGMHGLRPRT